MPKNLFAVDGYDEEAANSRGADNRSFHLINFETMKIRQMFWQNHVWSWLILILGAVGLFSCPGAFT